MPWKRFSVRALFIVWLISVCSSSARADELPLLSEVPDFTFSERSGAELKLQDLKGSVWICNFIFTRCHGQCPLMSGRMAGLQEKCSGSGIQLVSFSVDPLYDTPERLQEYALRYGAREAWFFLTGEKSRMWKFITEGFSLGVEEASPEDLAQGAESVIHSSRFVLVDGEGNIRGYYDSSDPAKMEALVRNAFELAASLGHAASQ